MGKRSIALRKLGTAGWTSAGKAAVLYRMLGVSTREAGAYIAALPDEPSKDQIDLIDRLFSALITSGVFQGLDMLQLYAVDTAANALVDLKNPSSVATAVNSPTFTPYRGYNGDGATSYVDTGYNPASGPNYTQNSASLGVWSLTSGQSASSALGWVNASNIGSIVQPRSTSDLFGIRVNMTGGGPTVANTNGIGLYVATRSDASNMGLFKNGVSLGSGTAASQAVVSANFNIGHASSTGYSSAQVAAAFAGSNLSSAKHLAFYNALSTYMTAVGAQ